ncbi:MAG: glycoside hydrolase [Firmicutes bacterium]|nr:glycoside hydrolase [Bacillota bacterium]
MHSVWKADDGNGYRMYRIPCIVATRRGTLLAACEARMSNSDWAAMDLVLKRSVDGGASWSENVILARGAREGVTYNNPVLIADGELVHLLYCREYACEARGGGVFYTRSGDDGLSWSAPREITARTHPAGYARNLLATGPGHGLAHSNGTLIAPVWMTRPTPDSRAHRPSDISTLYSKDRGLTWQMGEVLRSAGEMPNMSESCAAELSDGSVLLNIRNESPKKRRAVAVSPNGCGGWSKPAFDETLTDPICMAGILRYDARTLLFCNPDSESGRQNLTLRFSRDDGQSWPEALVVDPDAAAYADLAVMGDTIYVLYEKSPDIRLAAVKKARR